MIDRNKEGEREIQRFLCKKTIVSIESTGYFCLLICFVVRSLELYHSTRSVAVKSRLARLDCLVAQLSMVHHPQLYRKGLDSDPNRTTRSVYEISVGTHRFTTSKGMFEGLELQSIVILCGSALSLITCFGI